jgi:sorting nexin-8
LQHPTPIRAYSQTSSNGFAGLTTPNANTYKESSTASPWDVGPLKAGLPATVENVEDSNGDTNGFAVDAADTGVVNSDVEPVESRKGWWKDLESIDVTIMAEKEGWFLQKYRVESNVSCRAIFAYSTTETKPSHCLGLETITWNSYAEIL